MGVIPVGVSGFGAVSAVGVGGEATRAGLFAPPPRPALPRRFGTELELPVFEIASLPGTPGIAAVSRWSCCGSRSMRRCGKPD